LRYQAEPGSTRRRFNRLPFVGFAGNFLRMSAPNFDVQYVARLARIELTPTEEQKLGAQLSNILGYIEKLKELDVSTVEPTAHAVPMVNVTRPDEVRPGLSNEEALRNAPARAGGLFVVPKIVE
jgi:aspartyl-tRNA(Asn)/glutamyl-tRNA(Gln) amidotransferase subunit C